MGFFRLFLAIDVISSHALGNAFGISLFSGHQAVHIFYAISGFYMAYILNEIYLGKGSIKRFAINRILKIWPPYLVGLVLMISVLLILKNTYFWHVFITLEWWGKLWAIFSNIFLLGLDTLWYTNFGPSGLTFSADQYVSNGYNLLLNHPAFSIAIEVSLYVLAPLFVRSWKKTCIFFAIGAAYHLILKTLGMYEYILYYHVFASAWIYFGAGAITYHLYKLWKSSEEKKKTAYLWGGIFLILISLISWYLGGTKALQYAILAPFLFHLTRNSKKDQEWGNLAYPVYLIHWPIVVLTQNWEVVLFNQATQVAMITIPLAIAVHWFVSRPISRMRDKIRGKKV